MSYDISFFWCPIGSEIRTYVKGAPKPTQELLGSMPGVVYERLVYDTFQTLCISSHVGDCKLTLVSQRSHWRRAQLSSRRGRAKPHDTELRRGQFLR